MASNMVRRVAFAAVAIPVAVGIIWLGGWPLALLVAVISVLGTRELLELATRAGVRPWRAFGLAAAASFAPLTWLALSDPAVAGHLDAWWPYLGAGGVLVALLGTLARVGSEQRPLAAAGVTLFGPLYAGALPAFVLVLRHGTGAGVRSWAGVALVFFPLVVTWVCDSAAMAEADGRDTAA